MQFGNAIQSSVESLQKYSQNTALFCNFADFRIKNERNKTETSRSEYYEVRIFAFDLKGYCEPDNSENGAWTKSQLRHIVTEQASMSQVKFNVKQAYSILLNTKNKTLRFLERHVRCHLIFDTDIFIKILRINRP